MSKITQIFVKNIRIDPILVKSGLRQEVYISQFQDQAGIIFIAYEKLINVILFGIQNKIISILKQLKLLFLGR